VAIVFSEFLRSIRIAPWRPEHGIPAARAGAETFSRETDSRARSSHGAAERSEKSRICWIAPRTRFEAGGENASVSRSARAIVRRPGPHFFLMDEPPQQTWTPSCANRLRVRARECRSRDN